MKYSSPSKNRFNVQKRRPIDFFLLAFLIFFFSISSAKAEEGSEIFAYTHLGDKEMPAIVLAHDWFGNSQYYQIFSKKLSQQGYSVFALDLYEKKPSGNTHAEAWQLMQAMSSDHAANVIDQGIRTAGEHSNQVFTIGFSMGAPHSLEAAIRNSEIIDGAIIFYGDPILDADKLSKLNGPVLAIFGSADGTYGDTSAADVAAQFSKAADEVGKKVEVHIYPGAAHAFAQPLFNAGETYDPVAAESAWKLTLDFLQRVSGKKTKSENKKIGK